ncbi:MAG: helix-turn-helix domain-containing protein [Thermoanaerobaculia bacterium]
MDLVLKLRELRRLRGLTQRVVARRSGIGEKTISSFETGDRIDAMTLVQLQKLLTVYGVTECDFFGSAVEREIAPWKRPANPVLESLQQDLSALPPAPRDLAIEKIRLILDLARDFTLRSRPTDAGRSAASSHHS